VTLVSLFITVMAPLALVLGGGTLAYSAARIRDGREPVPVIARFGAAMLLVAGFGLIVVTYVNGL
jgi:hypothetical protein